MSYVPPDTILYPQAIPNHDMRPCKIPTKIPSFSLRALLSDTFNLLIKLARSESHPRLTTNIVPITTEAFNEPLVMIGNFQPLMEKNTETMEDAAEI